MWPLALSSGCTCKLSLGRQIHDRRPFMCAAVGCSHLPRLVRRGNQGALQYSLCWGYEQDGYRTNGRNTLRASAAQRQRPCSIIFGLRSWLPERSVAACGCFFNLTPCSNVRLILCAWLRGGFHRAGKPARHRAPWVVMLSELRSEGRWATAVSWLSANCTAEGAPGFSLRARKRLSPLL